MVFWEKIDKTGERIDIYEKIKKDNTPLYIYGAGNLAKNILKKLNEYEIKVAGCITDTGEEKFESYQVYKYSTFIKNVDKRSCNLLIGFASAYARKQEIEQKNIFKCVYEIANPFDHHTHFDYKFVEDNKDKLSQVYEQLADEYSKECFVAFINSRIWEDSGYVRDIFRGEIDEFNNDVMRLESTENFLDIGAYDGGSIKRFLKSSNGKYQSIIGIEPESRNFSKLERFCDINKIHAKLYQIGCWNKKDRLYFNDADDKCCRLDKTGAVCIEVDRVDNIIAPREKVSIINLGISTAEREIIEGCQNIITNNRPKILVFMGSAKEELYTIPDCIHKISKQYNLYLRFIQAMPSRIFMYAIPQEMEE